VGDKVMSRLVVLNQYGELLRVYDEYGNLVNNPYAMYTEEGIYRVFEAEQGLYVVVRVRLRSPNPPYDAYYEVVLLEEPNTELIDVGIEQISIPSEEKIREVALHVLKKYRYKRKAETEVV